MSRPARCLLPSLALLLVALAAAPAAAQERTLTRSVTAEGTGRVEVVPDIARLHFGVSARRPTVAEARDEVAAGVEKIIGLARRMGIADRNIATAAAQVSPEYDWDPRTQERRNLGYRVTRQVELKLEDLAKLGEITEQALGLGVTDASPATLDTSRRKEVEAEALAAATRDARERAGVMAAALGETLGEALRITAVADAGPPVPMARMAMEADSGGAQTYETGLIVITASVTGKFALTGQ